MRLEPNGEKPQGGQGWTRIRARERRERIQIKESQRTRRRVSLESLQPEALEERQLLATLPAPLKPSELQNMFDPNTGTYPFAGIQNVYSPTALIGSTVRNGTAITIANGEASTNVSSPILSVDPLNPDHQVVVAQLNQVPLFGSPTARPVRTIGYVTQNGGTSWTPLNLPGPQSDPTVTSAPIPNLYVQDISVAFDRSGNIHVVQSQTNNPTGYGNAGYLQYRKFDPAGNILLGGATSAAANIYSWNRTITTPDQSQQPSWIKPYIAVDSNPTTFTDPVTGQTQNDPNSGAVYIGFVQQIPGTAAPLPALQIRAITSLDGGASFFTTPPTTTNNQLIGTLATHDGATQTSMPRISMAVGPGGGLTPGSVTFVWDDYTSATGSNTNQSTIRAATYAPSALSVTGLAVVRPAALIARSSLAGANAAGQYPLGTNITAQGIGPAPSIAIDNTLGSFSPNKGKIYVTYVDRDFQAGVDNGTGNGNPLDNTDIYMVVYDPAISTWTGPFLVNDDLAEADGYSGAQYVDSPTGRVLRNGLPVTAYGGRPQFLPAVAVDQYTGTVGVSYLDTRYDSSRIRVVNSVQTSIDGGVTYSRANNANLEASPTDVITGDTVFDIPVPDNQGAANPVRDATWGFGVRSSIQMFAGQIFPAWSFNYNAGYVYGNGNTGLIRGNVAIGRMYTSAGPRVIESTMGAVRSWQAGTTNFNNTFNTSGVQQVDGFSFTFDRPVVINSVTDSLFLPSNFLITYTDVNGNQSQIPVTSVIPLDPQGTGNAEATQFFAQFAPQSAVGTYSYSIGPGNIRDAIRTVDAGGIVKIGNLMDQDNIPDRIVGVDTSYATPAPLNPLVPGSPPYDNATLPLIVSGPYVTGSQLGRYNDGDKTQPVIWTPTSTGELLALNVNPSQINFMAQFIDVTFDRNMDATTFTTADILEMRGPAGLIDPSAFTITPNPNGTDPDAAFPRTYRIEFPNQRVSGQYSLVLGANIASSTGDLMDSNRNAGLYVLRGASPSGPTVTQTYNTGTTAAIAAATIDSGTLVVTPSVNRLKLTVGDSFLINQFANIKINVTFPKDTDLTGYLVAPDGSRTLLFSGVGQAGTGANFTETVFDDTAQTPIQNGGSPFFGRFKPQQSLLNNLLGINAKGDWYLEIENKGLLVGTINSLTLNLGEQIPETGLGEPVADRSTLDFRIFTMNVDNSLSADQWVMVGPAGINNGAQPASTINPELGGTTSDSGAGRVSTVALDPSDTSGNTVYIGVGTGGVFKTTNFLTNDPRGPIWQDLTGFGPTNSLNSGTIAIFGRNSDPGQSIVLVGTGEPAMLNPPSYGQTYTPNTAAGVGVLISPDGGRTWKILDSTVNYDSAGNYLPLTSPQRDHRFLGTTIQKIVVDPRPTTTGETIIYMAVYNPATPSANGIWKSINTGRSWTLMRAGAATDIVLDQASGVVNAISNPAGNLQIGYAAFQGEGVFLTNNRGVSWSLMNGGVGKPLWRDTTAGTQAVNVTNNPSPNGGFGRILLTKPALTGNATQDLLYSGWVYAVVANTGNNGIQGVYVTKDFGQNWTKIEIRTLLPVSGSANRAQPQSGTTDTQDYNFGFNESDYALSLTIDPTNPNVIYLGGAFGGIGTGQPESMIRVDISRMSDANAFFMGTYGVDGGAITPATNNIIGLEDPTNTGVSTFPPPPPFDPRLNGISTYTNMYRNPSGPLVADSTINVKNSLTLANAGTGARWVPMGNSPSDIALGVALLGNSLATPFGSNSYGATSLQQLVTTVDPLTGRTRVIAVTNNGIYSGVDKGDGTLIRSIGNQVNNSGVDGNVALPTGSRNGNLQTAQIYAVASQQSDIAAQVSGALFFAQTQRNGFPQSTVNILDTGNVTWDVPLNPLTGLPVQQLGGGSDVQANPNGGVYDAQGNIDPTSMLYQWDWPQASLNQTTNFFQVGQNYGTGVGRTFGLFQTNQGNWPDPQWPIQDGYKFAINPINSNQLLIGSNGGRVFATTNNGQYWLPVAEPGTTGSRASALAYGAPQTADSSADTNFYLFVGTTGGRLLVTYNGGGTWLDRTNGLDGTQIQRIVPNPERNSREAYVITQRGIYWKADMADGATAFTNITGNLYSLTSNAYGDVTMNFNLMQAAQNPLNGLVVDWRYLIPDNLANPTGPNHPILYVAGKAGVFRSMDKGITWEQFPPISDGASKEGGYLPNVIVTDLDIVTGNIDPATGRANMRATVIDPATGQPTTATGPNILLASTWGRGAYAIRLSPVIFQKSVAMSAIDPKYSTAGINPNGIGGSDSGFIANSGVATVDPLGRTTADNGVVVLDRFTNILQPYFNGISEQSAFGNIVTVNLYDLTAFQPSDYVDGNIPVGAPLIGTGTTDARGFFSVQVNAGYFKADGSTDGLKTIGLQAVNQSSTIGNIATIQYRLDTTPEAAPAQPILLDNTSLDNPPDTYTTFKQPRITINGTQTIFAPVPGVTLPVLPAFVRLYRGTVDPANYFTNAVASGAVTPDATDPTKYTITLQDKGLDLSPTGLPDGNYDYYAVAFDASGNPSGASQKLTITVDTTVPLAPTGITLVNNTDVYPANGLSVTNTPPPTLTISGIEPKPGFKTYGNKVIIYRDGVQVTTFTPPPPGDRVTGTNTFVTLTDTNNLADGVYVYTATQTDLAGNVSPLSAPLTVVIDTKAPTAPTVSALSNNTSNVPPLPGTNTPPPQLTVTGIDQFADTLQVPAGQQGATVYLYRDGVLVNTVAVVSPNTSAVIVDPTFTGLADGTYVYTASQRDVSGNLSTISSGFSIIVDTTSPAAPTGLTLVSDTGIAGDNITNNNKPTFSANGLDQNVGTTPIPVGAAGGPTLILYRNGAEVARKVVTGQVTTDQIQDPGPVPDGTYTYSVNQIDAVGNVSPVGGSISVTIDTTTPAQPSAPVLYPADDSGVPGDNLTNVVRPRLQGQTVANYLVRFYEIINGVPTLIGSKRANPLGNNSPLTNPGQYLFQVPTPLTDGPHTFFVTVENVAGTVSAPSPTLTITIDTRIPNVPPPTINLDPRDDSASVGDNITNIRRPRFYGNAEKNQAVDLLIKDTANPLATFVVYATTVANSTNTYSIQVPPDKPLADGVYIVMAQVRTVAGNVANSNQLTLTVDATAPAAPPAPMLRESDDTGIAGDYITANRRPTFISSAPITSSPAGTRVELLNSKGQIIGTGVLDASGQYSIQLAQALYNGSIGISARLIDAAGNRSGSSPSILVTIITVPDDYNGDGRSDYPLYDRSTSSLKVLLSNSTDTAPVYVMATFAVPAADQVIPVSGDFDGDGKYDPAIYNQTKGIFHLQMTTFGKADLQFANTSGGELPYPADFDGDGATDSAIYNPVNQLWTYVLSTSTGVFTKPFGAPNSEPLPADYSGDGKADFGVTYVSDGKRYFEYLDSATNARTTVQLGGANSIPVPADYNLDFKADVAVAEPVNGKMIWSIRQVDPADPTQFITVNKEFGLATDVPTPDDYNGDGKAELAVYTPMVQDQNNANATIGGVWSYLDSSLTPPVTVTRNFGITGGVAVNSPLQFRLAPVPVPNAGAGGNAGNAGTGSTGGIGGNGGTGSTGGVGGNGGAGTGTGTSTPPPGNGGPAGGSTGSGSGGASTNFAPSSGTGTGTTTGSSTTNPPVKLTAAQLRSARLAAQKAAAAARLAAQKAAAAKRAAARLAANTNVKK